MSGHSKWSTIKHKKGAMDAKRGKVFTKIIKEIMVAAREGGADPNSNPGLRTALIKAKAANMPKDNIDRAIKKGSGELGGSAFEEIFYEGYGPSGVALLIQVLTDNRNRTAAEIRNILSKGGGNLGETGCVSYLFSRRGVIAVDSGKYTEDDVIAATLEAGADDVTSDSETIEVITAPDDFEKVLDALGAAGIAYTVAEIAMVPGSRIELDHGKTQKALKLIENLEDVDDVQAVASNMEIPEDFVLAE
jgi:YebC/PmpR family DNA-binding regulatory protein